MLFTAHTCVHVLEATLHPQHVILSSGGLKTDVCWPGWWFTHSPCHHPWVSGVYAMLTTLLCFAEV